MPVPWSSTRKASLRPPSARSVASPSPAEAPVTMATLPASSRASSTPCVLCERPGLLAGDSLDGFLRDRHHAVELRLGDDERRREEHVLHAGPRDDAAL